MGAGRDDNLSKFFNVLTLVAVCIFCIAIPVSAEKQHLEAVGTYTLGDRDTRDVAERRAIVDAMRVATQKAGIYVESYSKTNGFVLTKDQVNMIAASIIRMYDQDVAFINNGTVCQATVYVIAETADIDKLISGMSGANNATKQRPQPRSIADMESEYGLGQNSTNITNSLVDVTSYTGIVLDCKDSIQYGSFSIEMPGISANEIKAKDGRILLSNTVPTKKYCTKYVRYIGCYDPKQVEKNVGENPLWIQVLYIDKPKKRPSASEPAKTSGTMVISDEDADILQEMQERMGILNGEEPPVLIIGGNPTRYRYY